MKRPVWLLTILLLATFLRFHCLGCQSFWNDEGNSARLSERSLSLIIEGTASDIHPPLYYLILRGWRELVGETEFGLRSFSAFVGVLTVALTIAIAQNWIKQRQPSVSLWAGWWAAIHPALIYYSQETRMYALLAFWGILSTWLLIHSKKRVMALLYLVVLTAGLYTHYFFPVILGVHGAMTLAKRSWKGLWEWAGMVLGSVLLYSPWLPIFWRQLATRPRTETALPAFLNTAGHWLAFGETLPSTSWLGLLLLVVIGLAWISYRPKLTESIFIWLGVLLPIALIWLTGTTRPAFYKFLLLAVPFFCLLLGQLGWFRHQLLAGLLALPLLWLMGQSLNNLYQNPAYQRADYRGIAERIAMEGGESAGILLNAPNQWEVFTYYHQQGAPVYPIPRANPNPMAIDAELSQITAQHDRLYVLFWGDGERDPERLVERWLDSHAYKASEEWVKDVRLVVYAVPDAPATEIAIPTQLVFGDQITLLGYTLSETTLAPGDIIQLTLFWQALTPLTTRYKVFLHLVSDQGLVAQRDSEPGGNLALTTTWQVGQTVIDNHGLLLPSDLPPGDYQLLLGLYNLLDANARLPLPDQTTAYPLATISVRR